MQLDVHTRQGALRGRERRGVALFAGIPYAAPPVGDLRWAPPQAAAAWSDVRDATRFGPAAPQLAGDALTNSKQVAWSEADCLTLNVTTPAADDGARPVMVWIHGGAFRNGTGAIPWYDGSGFASNGDIVVVSINYRLGALGFCRMPGAPTSGINGILDQIAALEWVRDNIAAFGGDPARVTIAGESAGAFSVTTLTAMGERTRGLFRSTIAQSGAGHHTVDTDVACTIAERFLVELGVDSLDEARGVPPHAVLQAQQRVETTRAEFMSPVVEPFYPCVDGDILAGRPIDLLAAGAGSEVAMLTGTNGDEMTLFGLGQVDDAQLSRTLGHYAQPVDELLEVYRAELPDATSGELAIAFTTDFVFRIPAIRVAEARAQHDAPTWMYEFDWKSKAFGGVLGATHALEIPFTFDTLDAAGVDVFTGVSEPPRELGRAMHQAWTMFIRDGEVDWPTYDSTDRTVMRFADDIGVVHDPSPATRKVWSGVR